MKLIQLANAAEAIGKIARQELPMKTLYKVSRQIEKVRSHLKFYDEKREEILRKYCGEPDGERYRIPEGCAEEVRKALEELYNVEAEEIHPLEIDTEEGMRLSCDDIDALHGIIEIRFPEDGEEEK